MIPAVSAATANQDPAAIPTRLKLLAALMLDRKEVDPNQVVDEFYNVYRLNSHIHKTTNAPNAIYDLSLSFI